MKQLQQVNSMIDSLKSRVLQSEEQVNFFFSATTFTVYYILIGCLTCSSIWQMKACLMDALKSTQEDRHLAISLETAKWDLADAERDLKWLKYAYSCTEKEYEQIQQKNEEVQRELEAER